MRESKIMITIKMSKTGVGIPIKKVTCYVKTKKISQSNKPIIYVLYY